MKGQINNDGSKRQKEEKMQKKVGEISFVLLMLKYFLNV